MWEDAVVILHGDHGSRLNLVEPLPQYEDQLRSRDYMDAFPTLLAVRRPGFQFAFNQASKHLASPSSPLCRKTSAA